MNVLRAEALAQAQRMIKAVAALNPGDSDFRAGLQSNPVEGLSRFAGVQVRIVPDAQTGGSGCSVAGGYVASTSPPTLVVADSLSRRRPGFTVLHELGHHLQQNDFELVAAVMAQAANPVAFEDAACDAFAGRMLVPDTVLDGVLQGRTPNAADVVELYRRSRASRSAACVRMTERLGSSGIVAVLDPDGKVVFASSGGELFPPARDSDQSGTPLVSAALRSGTDASTERTFIRYRTGSTSDELYGDAAWCDGYLIVVEVLDRASWLSYSPPRPRSGEFVAPARPWCEVCEEEFTAGPERCPKCREPLCPRGHCSCTRARERVCQGCFLKKHPSQFPMATATLCADCSE